MNIDIYVCLPEWVGGDALRKEQVLNKPRHRFIPLDHMSFRLTLYAPRELTHRSEPLFFLFSA
jgi:hypothetical protein